MPLRVLFLDMNSYFASVEQQLRPELRGRPVAVAAIDVDSTCCIAASYEAKRLGIRTGTPVWQARKCKGIRIVEARPDHQIIEAVESCIPVHAVHSIDELSCRLSPAETEPSAAVELAHRVKRAVRDQVGSCLTCSIGLAPNRLLAKVAADMQKPDGLITIIEEDLPDVLYGLHLDDLPGIGPRMLKRLNSAGLETIEQLYQNSESQMKDLWGGVVGQRWWHWLRGHDLPEDATRRSTIGHSHVLPPELRTEEGAQAVLVRMIHKVGARLRRINYWARRLEVYFSFTFREEGWKGSIALGLCQDTQSIIEAFHALWRRRPKISRPTQVAVTLYDLVPNCSASPPLFPAEERRLNLARTVDRLNHRFGPDTVYFGGMHGMNGAAPTRIAFNQIPDLALDLGQSSCCANHQALSSDFCR
jgi:DNA polymerase-4